eukprot:4249268-Alexandrium_andersonii.AAC.1
MQILNSALNATECGIRHPRAPERHWCLLLYMFFARTHLVVRAVAVAVPCFLEACVKRSKQHLSLLSEILLGLLERSHIL